MGFESGGGGSRQPHTDVARRAGLLVVLVAFVFFGGLLDSFSEGRTEVLLHPPGYLCGTRVLVGTVNHTQLLERRTDTSCVGQSDGIGLWRIFRDLFPHISETSRRRSDRSLCGSVLCEESDPAKKGIALCGSLGRENEVYGNGLTVGAHARFSDGYRGVTTTENKQ